MIGTHLPRERQTIGRRTDDDDGAGAGSPGKRGGAEPDRAGALDEHGITERQACTLDDVHGREQAASAADVGLERHRVGQLRDHDAGFEVHHLRPSAEEAVGR